jgi:hypothetical protein
MKKIFLVLAAALCVATVSAQNKFESSIKNAAQTIASQQWSVGARLGSGFQAQAECFYGEKTYIEARFGMSFLSDKATHWMGEKASKITADFTVLHNWNVLNWDWTPSVGSWFLDAGCGINLGGCPAKYDDMVLSHFYIGAAGMVKFGIKFNNVPIRLAIDWTPVLGAEIYSGKYDGEKINSEYLRQDGKAANFYKTGLANFAVSATYCF